ncbi:protein-disulfide reductase DsbD domain-containing protein [Thermodesulfobacteriota bacterium]
MNYRVVIFLLLLIFMGGKMLFAQEAAIVTILPVKQVIAARGETVQLTVRAKIKKGFHIQANPAADEFLIATTLTIEADENIVPGNPVYPPGIPYRLEGSTEDLLTYEDEMSIILPVKVLESASPGKVNITGRLRFQACDDIKCLYPRSIPVVIPVEIVDSQE